MKRKILRNIARMRIRANGYTRINKTYVDNNNRKIKSFFAQHWREFAR